MNLNADLPKWVAWPLRLLLYAFVMFILFNIAAALVAGRVANNTAECNAVVSGNGGALSHAKAMVSCLRSRNGIFENLLMRSLYNVIDGLPNAPVEFVGVWDATQPRCHYRHTLKANGEFISEPKGCSLSADTYHGVWGVYEDKMIWLPEEGLLWPPDINDMDVVDKDFFLLVEQDGTRTKFSRVREAATAAAGIQEQAGRTQSSVIQPVVPEGALQQETPVTPPVLPDYMHALPFESVAMYPGALATSADGNVAAHIALDGTIVVWNPHTYEMLESIPQDGESLGRPGTLALSADGGHLAIGRFDAVVVVHSRHESRTIRELRGHVGAISALAFSPDSKLLASGGDDATTYVWDVGSGRRLHAFDSQFEGSYRGGIVVGLGFTGDARALAVNEWYSRHYDVERGTTLWDLETGIEIGTRGVAPPNGDNVMRSGHAVGANNWLLAYTSSEGLALERLDACDKPRIAGPAAADHTLRSGMYANTVAADPHGRWVAALDYQQLLFYTTTGDAAPLAMELPVRPIALLPHPDGSMLLALAISETRANGNEHFIFGRDAETVTAGALYAITIPETLRQLPALEITPNARRCPPTDASRKQWSYRLPDSAPVLPVKARLEPPGEMPSPEGNDPLEDQKRFNPPSDLYFADDGTLYVLHHANSDAQSGVVVWDPAAQRVVRSHFQTYAGETPFRMRHGWATRQYNQLQDLQTGQLLLDATADEGQVNFATDAETGEIYRIVDGRLERYGADAKPRPLATRGGTPVVSVAARNGNLAVIYADGEGEVWNTRTDKSRPFKSTAMISDGCEIVETPLLSADGHFLQIAWGCVDSPVDYPITDLRNGVHVASGPILGPFPTRSTRVVMPDARPNHLDVWDLNQQQLLGRLPRHPSRDKNGNYRGLLACLSEDGRMLASASYDGLVRVWDIDAKSVIGEITVGGSVTAMAFDLAGRSLAVSTASGEVLILDTMGVAVVPRKNAR